MSLSKLREITKENKNKELNLDCLDICIIIPAPIKGSGGHRNFFRAIKYLRDFGHNVTVYYTQTTQTADKVKKLVSDWFYDMDGINFVKFNGYLGYHDIGIATWWETAYNLADNIEFVKYPFYFVQDFEPWFYPMSSWYILAENSYRLGFTHICSGEWCKKFLEEKYNAKAEYFQFPLDTKIYNQKVQRTKFNKNIVFFAKPEMARRCYEFGLKVFSIISILRPDIEIIFYGSNQLDPKDIPFKCTVLKILPTLDDLANLYRNADLGVVFSTTNPSLVPYEMMSCGCPVADMNISNAISKYGNNEDNVFLFEANPDIFAQKILDIIDNKDILQQKATAGAIWVKNEFPTELQMAKIVENIIKTTIKNTENLNLK